MKKLYLLISFFVTTATFSQAPQIQWQKTLGGSSYDEPYSVKNTADGGFIFSGQSYSDDGDVGVNQGGWDSWIIKTTSLGNVEWQKNYGGSYNDQAAEIIQTTDGGYAFAGYTYSNDGDVSGNHGSADGWVVKLNSSGDMEWQVLLGTSGQEGFQKIVQTPDGGFIAAGNKSHPAGENTYFNYWVVKLGSDGAVQWQQQYGSDIEEEWLLGLSANSDNTFMLTGFIQTHDGNSDADYWIIKIDSLGAVIWESVYGNSPGDVAYKTVEVPTGGYIVVGYSEAIEGPFSVFQHRADDIWVVRIDNEGEILWDKYFGSWGLDQPIDIMVTSGGGFEILARSTQIGHHVTVNHGYSDYWLLNLDLDGNLVWQKSYGGSNDEFSSSFVKTPDGGYLLTGASYSSDGDVSANQGLSDGWMLRLSPAGENPPAQPDYVSLQDATASIVSGSSTTVHGRILVSGLTDVPPNIIGQAAGIQVWIGISPEDEDSPPHTWSNWVLAQHNASYVGEMDEYSGTIDHIFPGTYRYTFRFLLDDGSFSYAGINSQGVGGFWDGTEYISGVLTVTNPELPIAGSYTTLLERLTSGQPNITFSQEQITQTAPNTYRTTNVALYHPPGGVPGIPQSIELPAGTPGYTFKQVGTRFLVPDQNLADYWGNIVKQSPEQFAASTYDIETGVITVEYTITFNTGDQDYRSTYTPVELSTPQLNKEGLRIYPNPVGDILNIGGIDGEFLVEVFNLLGQRVQTSKVDAANNSVDTSQLASGTYLVRLVTESKSTTLKIVKR